MFLFSDVLEFLEDISEVVFPHDLQLRYQKLLEDVSNVFEDPEEVEYNDEDGDDDDRRFVVEEETCQQVQYEGDDDGADDDTNFVPFPPRNRNYNVTTPSRYPYMGQESSESGELYDETNLNQDYEPVSFGKSLHIT